VVRGRDGDYRDGQLVVRGRDGDYRDGQLVVRGRDGDYRVGQLNRGLVYLLICYGAATQRGSWPSHL
jgi:hypothetical protein